MLCTYYSTCVWICMCVACSEMDAGILYQLAVAFYNKNTDKLLEQKQIGMSFAVC